MLNHLPDNNIPYWDYIFVDGSHAPRDSSSAVISACGLYEMCNYIPENSSDWIIFKNAGNMMLEAVIDNCMLNYDSYDGLICHVTHAFPQGQGIDECAVYGDYFFLEALLRYVRPDFKKYW